MMVVSAPSTSYQQALYGAHSSWFSQGIRGLRTSRQSWKRPTWNSDWKLNNMSPEHLLHSPLLALVAGNGCIWGVWNNHFQKIVLWLHRVNDGVDSPSAEGAVQCPVCPLHNASQADISDILLSVVADGADLLCLGRWGSSTLSLWPCLLVAASWEELRRRCCSPLPVLQWQMSHSAKGKEARVIHCPEEGSGGRNAWVTYERHPPGPHGYPDAPMWVVCL